MADFRQKLDIFHRNPLIHPLYITDQCITVFAAFASILKNEKCNKFINWRHAAITYYIILMSTKYGKCDMAAVVAAKAAKAVRFASQI